MGPFMLKVEPLKVNPLDEETENNLDLHLAKRLAQEKRYQKHRIQSFNWGINGYTHGYMHGKM